MPDTQTTELPALDTGPLTAHENLYQVILHNDDRNTMDHVVRCLMRVFGHGEQLAVKIMFEAHEKGSAIAEVEAESLARLHRDQLRSLGLTATLEKA